MHNFKKLEIWNKSMDFVTEIYKLTQTYPKHEVFGLCSQTQRAACSIPLNIAEGSAKSSTKDFIRFLEIAFGSSHEVETALIIARNLEYISTDTLIEKQNKITEIQKMIFKFKKSLNQE
ncbi:MAG: rRNA-intervening sequence protein [Bacteroidetes bacterium]|nr:rRNA-intervening sequence protein [Bacteroidota bacterium]